MNRILQRDTAGVFRFAALQSAPGRNLLVRCVAADSVAEALLGARLVHWAGGGALRLL
jgi:predicted DCC family thiol-disulfide oxidoreductase YuxK